jgi:hypothetical protein
MYYIYVDNHKLTENRTFFLSWFTALGSGMGSVCLITLTLSPAKIYLFKQFDIFNLHFQGKAEDGHIKITKFL